MLALRYVQCTERTADFVLRFHLQNRCVCLNYPETSELKLQVPKQNASKEKFDSFLPSPSITENIRLALIWAELEFALTIRKTLTAILHELRQNSENSFFRLQDNWAELKILKRLAAHFIRPKRCSSDRAGAAEFLKKNLFSYLPPARTPLLIKQQPFYAFYRRLTTFIVGFFATDIWSIDDSIMLFLRRPNVVITPITHDFQIRFRSAIDFPVCSLSFSF